MRSGRLLILFFLLMMSLGSFAQRTVSISGIIVDSATLVAIPNAHIRLKGSGTGMLATSSGAFNIIAPVFDTLIFSSVGYRSFEYPVLFNEEDVLIRLHESVIMLPEVVTVGTRIPEFRYAQRREVKMPAPTLAEGIFSPFTYFSKTEKEKRKLVKLRDENERVRTYVEVINDPDLKKDMLNEFGITEPDYYVFVARFNRENRYVQYLVNGAEIRELLVSFIRRQISNKK